MQGDSSDSVCFIYMPDLRRGYAVLSSIVSVHETVDVELIQRLRAKRPP